MKYWNRLCLVIFAVAAVALVPACGEAGVDDGVGIDPLLRSSSSDLSASPNSRTAAVEGVKPDGDSPSSSQVDGVAKAQRQSMLAAARAFLDDRNQQLMGGTGVSTAPAGQSVSALMTARVERDNADLRARRARLAELGERYTGFETRLRLVEARQGQGSTVARIEETTQYHYAKVHGDEPPYMVFQVERDFTFSRKNGAWVIEDVKLLEQGGLAPINEVVTTPATSLKHLLPPDQQGSPAPAPSSPSRDEPTPQAEELFEKGSGNNFIAAYNYRAMANYATTYALSYNPAYRSFPMDCTNFISQAVFAGGWTMVPGWYRSNNAWWYNWLNQTYTWAGAHNWYFFATGSGRTYILSNVWYMGLADVLQMDFQRDWHIDHTMMVTYVGSSDLYLSYHTTDTLNRSLKSIIAQYPSAYYWAHRT